MIAIPRPANLLPGRRPAVKPVRPNPYPGPLADLIQEAVGRERRRAKWAGKPLVCRCPATRTPRYYRFGEPPQL